MRRKLFQFFLTLSILCFCGCGTSILSEIKEYVQTSAPLESKYLETGPYAVKCIQRDAGDYKLKEFRIWYPAELEENRKKQYPAIVICNGTGYRATRFMTVFRHLASWGFVVIGTEEKWTGKGRGAILCLKFLLNENQTPDSPFYRKIDPDRLGIAGHSQGGAGAINAVTKYPEGKYFKALFTISGINQTLAESWLMRCPYDPGRLKIPIMMTATSNPYGWDEDHPERKDLGICTLASLKENRDAILKQNDTTVIIARVANKKKYHAENLAMSTPYMTAWFVYWLQGDASAGRFFLGNDPELSKNPCWQDVEIHLQKQK